MTKLKLIAMTALATAAVGIGGLAAAPTASAMPIELSCSSLNRLSRYYDVTGDLWLRVYGNPGMANRYYEQARYYDWLMDEKDC